MSRRTIANPTGSLDSEIEEKVLYRIFGAPFNSKDIIRFTIQEKDKDFEKEKDKWIEERGRMAELLFKKGIENW